MDLLYNDFRRGLCMKHQNLLTINRDYLNRVFENFQSTSVKKNNQMIACGKVFTPIHETIIESINYYEFMFECNRSENNSDVLHVIVKKTPQTGSLQFTEVGTELTLIGFLRSINWHDETGKRHLNVMMQAIDFEFHTSFKEDGFDNNIVILSGHICTEPTFKTTSLNRPIAEFRIAIRDTNNTDIYYIPLVVWGKKAVEVSEHYKVGDKLTLLGRVQSRIYYKKLSETDGEHRVAYEVSTRYMIRHSK